MKKQTLASFKKEFLLFTRTFRLMGVCLVFIAFAILDPIMVKGMKLVAEWYDDMLQTVTADADIDFNFSMGSLIEQAYGEEPAVSMGVVQATTDMSGIDIIIMIIILNFVAGGEQKKRSTIIPACSGLRPFSYSLPKFIIYPTTAFIAMTVAMCFSYFTSLALFSINDVAFADILISGAFMGLYAAFFAALHLFIGISTGKPSLSVVICIVTNMFLPSILSIMGVADKFNPYALVHFSQNNLFVNLSERYSNENIFVSIIVTIILMAIMFFLTLFIDTAKRIDNRSEKMLI